VLIAVEEWLAHELTGDSRADSLPVSLAVHRTDGAGGLCGRGPQAPAAHPAADWGPGAAVIDIGGQCEDRRTWPWCGGAGSVVVVCDSGRYDAGSVLSGARQAPSGLTRVPRREAAGLWGDALRARMWVGSVWVAAGSVREGWVPAGSHCGGVELVVGTVSALRRRVAAVCSPL
jgi:hypothetical protein